MALPDVDVRRFTRTEYERLAEDGFLEPDERVELIDGIIYNMPPQSSLHATGVRLTEEVLRRAFPSGFDVRGQFPLAVDDHSLPEPDLAVVPGTPRDFAHQHPSTAVLVVEVADSSLLHDRRRKVPLYARAGIPECWILNLPKQCLEVHRDPAGGRYRTHRVLHRNDTVSPLANPTATIGVGELLP